MDFDPVEFRAFRVGAFRHDKSRVIKAGNLQKYRDEGRRIRAFTRNIPCNLDNTFISIDLILQPRGIKDVVLLAVSESVEADAMEEVETTESQDDAEEMPNE